MNYDCLSVLFWIIPEARTWTDVFSSCLLQQFHHSVYGQWRDRQLYPHQPAQRGSDVTKETPAAKRSDHPGEGPKGRASLDLPVTMDYFDDVLIINLCFSSLSSRPTFSIRKPTWGWRWIRWRSRTKKQWSSNRWKTNTANVHIIQTTSVRHRWLVNVWIFPLSLITSTWISLCFVSLHSPRTGSWWNKWPLSLKEKSLTGQEVPCCCHNIRSAGGDPTRGWTLRWC